MSRFLQLHCLTVYPPSNPNRSESGRPKTALYGDVNRLRLSSQSLKRAVRLSPVFQDALGGLMGRRTRRFGEEVRNHLIAKGADEDAAGEIAAHVASIFGKPADGDGNARIAQLAFISPEEAAAALALAESALEKGQLSRDEARAAAGKVLRTADSAVDLAMFGRMLADSPEYNRQAAVQVAHAITTHAAPEEEDQYTAIDDLAGPGERSGAGFMGTSGFGSGVFYIYVVVEITRLIENLDGDRETAECAVAALARAFALASPSGRRSAFAHHVRASFLRAEGGQVQPRSLACAFLRPVAGENLLGGSITRLREAAAALDRAYGPAADAAAEMDVMAGEGTLEDIAGFARDQVRHA